MREHSAGTTIGGRIAAGGLMAALAGGVFWAPAASAAGHVTALGDGGVSSFQPHTFPQVEHRPQGSVEKNSVTKPESATGASDRARPQEAAPGVVVPEGSSWTLRRPVPGTGSGSVTASVPGSVPDRVPGTVSETVDTGLPDGSSWT